MGAASGVGLGGGRVGADCDWLRRQGRGRGEDGNTWDAIQRKERWRGGGKCMVFWLILVEFGSFDGG
jgi:hypothetical protein